MDLKKIEKTIIRLRREIRRRRISRGDHDGTQNHRPNPETECKQDHLF